jgi:hypothetical protein
MMSSSSLNSSSLCSSSFSFFKSFFHSFSLFLFCFSFFNSFSLVSGQFTRLQYPVIASVTPNFGSVEGGTWITIVGANFASGGMFTNRMIFIAGQVCKEIPYFTTSQRVVCIAPACVEPQCRNDPNWQSSVSVSLDIYIQDVETIYGASSTFTYHGSYTPAIYLMSHYIRGNALSSVTGRTSTSQLEDLQIRIQQNLANLGDPGEFNLLDTSSYYMWSSSSQVNYLPPSDLTAGFYNLTFQSQDDQSHGTQGTGLARMFPKQPAYDNWGYPYGYNWDCSLKGTVYNVALFPTISSISPSKGSLNGGTLLTIKGSGFNKAIPSKNLVLVSGIPCDIVKVDFEEIQCRTRSKLNSNTNPSDDTAVSNTVFSRIAQVGNSGNAHQPLPMFTKTFSLNSTRNSGSPGWWVNVWNMQRYQNNQLTSGNIAFSFGWKEEMSYSLYYGVSNSWPYLYSYNSILYDWLAYAADLTTDLIAPIDGFYRFYMNCDDNCNLYGAHVISSSSSPSSLSAAVLLVSSPYSYIANTLYGKSSPPQSLFLKRGERYRLRVRLVNTGGADYLKIGMRIQPNETISNSSSFLGLMGESVSSSFSHEFDKRMYNFSMKTMEESPEFQHHHSLKMIQVVSLQIFYQREIQVQFLLPLLFPEASISFSFVFLFFPLVFLLIPSVSLCRPLSSLVLKVVHSL